MQVKTDQVKNYSVLSYVKLSDCVMLNTNHTLWRVSIYTKYLNAQIILAGRFLN